MIIVLGFLISTIDHIFSNDNVQIQNPDLSKLIASTKYEKQTGYKIQIEVHNGCGIPGIANLYTEFLRSEGFDVLDSKNANRFDYNTTQIINHSSDIKRAQSLAKIMQINQNMIIDQLDSHNTHDLTIIIGKDYYQLSSYYNALIVYENSNVILN